MREYTLPISLAVMNGLLKGGDLFDMEGKTYMMVRWPKNKKQIDPATGLPKQLLGIELKSGTLYVLNPDEEVQPAMIHMVFDTEADRYGVPMSLDEYEKFIRRRK